MTARQEPHMGDREQPVCGVCGDPAEVIATVPMCGERPRYPMCHECFEPITWCGYAEDVVHIDGYGAGNDA